MSFSKQEIALLPFGGSFKDLSCKLSWRLMLLGYNFLMESLILAQDERLRRA